MTPDRILVVDDEPLNVELLDQELSDLGYRVEKATNGQEARSWRERMKKWGW